MTDPTPRTDSTDPADPADPRSVPEPSESLPDPLADLDADPVLASAVLEVEAHVAAEGWDRPARLYALVDTAAMVQREPALAAAMGLDDAAEQGSLTAVEQDQLGADQLLEDVLASIVWPDSVDGCVAVVERLVLPPGADADLPEDPRAAQEYAAEHPDRQEVRITAGATRAGSTYCALRLRAHDDAASVVGGIDLVPSLLRLLESTLSADTPDTPETLDTLHTPDPASEPRSDRPDEDTP